MRRAVFIILAVGCLFSPIAAAAQPIGGTGNFGGAVGAGAPTVEDNIDVAQKEIEQARSDKTISAHRADRAEHKLKVIQHKLERLSREVSDIRHSIQ
jgi:hypothetical protein